MLVLKDSRVLSITFMWFCSYSLFFETDQSLELIEVVIRDVL